MLPTPRIGVIVAAGGTGSRFGLSGGKQLATLAGRPVVDWAVQPFLEIPSVQEIVIVCDPARVDEYARRLSESGVGDASQVRVVAGGATRQESVARGLEALSPDCDLVIVHDGARPLVTRALIEQVVSAVVDADDVAGAVAGHPSIDTLKRVDDAGDQTRVAETPDRTEYWAVQTPQVFRADDLRDAYGRAGEDGFLGTDDSSLVERLGRPVLLVEGPRDNIKITHAADLALAEAVLRSRTTGAGES